MWFSLCHFDPWEKSLVRQWGEISRSARNDNTVVMSRCTFIFCLSRGSSSWARRSRIHESAFRRRLFESFDKAQDRLRDFPSHLDLSRAESKGSGRRRRDPEGRARVRMVLGTFAETQVSRRAGRYLALVKQ